MNMLSAKKIRLHGMQSTRWTTKDKLTQYKGLINLYTRDRKILSCDSAIARKKQLKEIKQLRKDIKDNRAELDNAIQGDRQKLRNALAEHRDLQLGFQNLPPIRVIDHLHQGNFNQRKLLDRMNYRMKQKTQTLISLKLELAELEDRLIYEGVEPLPIEEQAQTVTGKVQDAILKKEAAIAVRATYKNILNILKKDSIYFDVVLGTLKYDSFVQSKCMIRTTELGQLATEYLDDRKQEFKELERIVKRDMKAREQSLKIVRKEVADLTTNMGTLIRRDSDINLGKVVVPRSSDDVALEQELENIQKILKTLQETTYVSSFEDICPCLQEQQKQSKRLQELLKKSKNDRDILLKKKDHADKMYTTLLYTMNSTTFEYKAEKQKLLNDIQAQINRKDDLKELMLQQGALLARVRAALQQLNQKCAIIKGKDTKADTKGAKSPRKAPTSAGAVLPPPYFEEDGIKIIDQLIPKLTILVNNAMGPLEGEKKDQAYKFFQALQSSTCTSVTLEDEEVEESLLSDIVIEDASVPTYNDIKAKSKQIVEIATMEDDIPPAAQVKKKPKSNK
ncbi:hypothetical protein PPYR_10324 [Photinus pyralis]|uniref:Uncharacterized protein n=2 Tax=Photinus pyralis TaxID=7054 RepID=A0A5N4AG32_PHOPY|nr:uncharacterized protein LOC116174676 [Photinus pyralis]KAB0796263.1 hypothetical protein PPYR_10324 [Photinus pyralis]